MLVGAARAAAADWVGRHAERADGFRGAYFSGSTVGLPDGAELPPSSDVDVVVVLDRPEAPPKPGKFVHRGALVEVTYLPWRELADAEAVLGSFFLAGGLRADTIIADPTGDLRRLHTVVARRFAEPAWVRRRGEHVRRKIEGGLRSIDPAAPWHAQVTTWLFATSLTAVVPLVAALRNPTVRLRYVAARAVLTERGRPDLHADLLALLGCDRLTPASVARHVAALAATFDATAAVARTPFFFSTDITPAARPIAIDGSHELVRTGRHREAVFWLAATFARCHTILAADAPAPGQAHAPAFAALLADLGIASTDDLQRRADDVSRFLPTLWRAAEEILTGNDTTPGR